MKNRHLTFSFIIPHHNGFDDLVKCLKSISDINYDKSLYEVIVIDDGSPKTILRKIKQISTPNTIIAKCERKGSAHARNLGIKKAKNKVLLFLDQDVVVDKNILNIYERVFNGKVVDIVQGNIWTQLFKSRLTNVHANWRHSAFLDKVKNENGFLRTLVTRNVAIKRSLLIKFSNEGNILFDESIPTTGGEDRELGYRLVNYGAQIALEEKAIVYHKDPANLWGILLQKYRHAMGDAKLGISERVYDLSNFYRVVIKPLRVGVPLYFSLLIWLFHIGGSEIEIAKLRLSRMLGGVFPRNHSPRCL